MILVYKQMNPCPEMGLLEQNSENRIIAYKEQTVGNELYTRLYMYLIRELLPIPLSLSFL
jgi:hypothetical protein